MHDRICARTMVAALEDLPVEAGIDHEQSTALVLFFLEGLSRVPQTCFDVSLDSPMRLRQTETAAGDLQGPAER